MQVSIQHTPWDETDGGAGATAEGLLCLDFWMRDLQYVYKCHLVLRALRGQWRALDGTELGSDFDLFGHLARSLDSVLVNIVVGKADPTKTPAPPTSLPF